MEIRIREVTAALWPDVEALFGARGACGGCWCWYWRLARGESWDAVKGDTARERLRRGIAAGTVMGVLAYVGTEPVGWCTFGPRPSFAKLDRSPSLRCDDAGAVWSVPCFFIRRGFRRRGVATALLAAAVAAIAARGGRIVEGYPVRPTAAGRHVDAFAWTGTRSLFEKAGFGLAGNPDGGKQRYRLYL
jgi:GNAT superfamily N-acetyltransferase